MAKQIRVERAKDGSHMTLTLAEDNLGEADAPPSASIAMDATDVDDFLSKLAELRVGMSEPIHRGSEHVSRPKIVVDPFWTGGSTNKPAGKVLVRHPGYGSVNFLLPIAEATAIATWLQSKPVDHPALP